MLIAAVAALAALLTFVSFVAPALLGSALALALAATACRLAALLLLRRAADAENPAERRGLQLLFLGEALFGAAVVTGLAIEPHGEGGLAGWAGLAVWLVYGAAGAWGGLKLIAAGGWVRAGGILIAVAAGFWFTQIGLVLWPFAMAAGYGCFAVEGIKLRSAPTG